MKKIIALALLLCLVLCAGCDSGSDLLSQEDARKIAIEALEVEESQVTDVHIHVTTYENAACYSFHITVDGASQEVIVDAATGEVLHIGESSH